MNLYWTVDMFFSAQTGFYEHGLLVQSSRRTLRHYLKTWFIFDFVVVFFDWVMIILEGVSVVGSSARVLRAFRMIRIIRLLRVAKLQNIVQLAEDALGYDSTQAMQLVMVVVKALLVILFSVHAAQLVTGGGQERSPEVAQVIPAVGRVEPWKGRVAGDPRHQGAQAMDL
eukprot:Skav205843  [mRNA]  locus=scaffold160:473117:479444:+ [translate_table: standard]